MEEIAEFLVAPDIYEQADAMIDLIYFALGTLVEWGSNRMSCLISYKSKHGKLGEDGKPIYNPKDGKS